MHEVVAINFMPARDLGNDRLGRQALPHHPQLLSKRPPPSPIRTGSTVTVIAFAH
jgi:hypothetical protein